LLELYTSEGCSSCPPAEEWLSHLKNHPGLWKDFVPVAFHVDYWDHLGWRDPFASKQWTERQSRYAAVWHNSSVYTPGFVLNGREWRAWSDGISSPNETKTGVLRATSNDDKDWVVEFEPVNKDNLDYDAHAVLLGCGISSKVRAGENSGRNLQHDFVALACVNATMQFAGGKLKARLTTKGLVNTSSRKAIALWVTRRDQLEPIQATGNWLP
jgi:hypothetical protein